jgi:hypothetical protein
MGATAIGRRNVRMRIEQPALTADGQGGNTKAWALLTVIWGLVEPLTQREALQAAQTTAVLSTAVTIVSGRRVGEGPHPHWHADAADRELPGPGRPPGRAPAAVFRGAGVTSYSALSPVSAGVYAALNVAAVTALATGGVGDDLGQRVPLHGRVVRDVRALRGAREAAIGGFGTKPGVSGQLPQIDLLVHVFSQFDGMSAAQAVMNQVIGA